MNQHAHPSSRNERTDARTERTARELFLAFTRLVLSQRYDEFGVSDVIREAGVARSTFYQHFRNKDDLLVTSMGPMLSVIADAAVGCGNEDDLRFVLSHFWENRALARVTLKGRPLELIAEALAGLIETRLRESKAEAPASHRVIAIERATGKLAAIRAWLTGRVACGARELSKTLCLVGHG